MRLARVYKELADRGSYVMLSNHNISLVKKMYKSFNIHVIKAKRNINSNGKKMIEVGEVIITNYKICVALEIKNLEYRIGVMWKLYICGYDEES